MARQTRTSLEGELRSLIAAGRHGDRLPSVRELVRRHRASPVTVQRLIARLEHEGLLEALPGRGTFVVDTPRRGAADLSWQTIALGARDLPAPGLAELLSSSGEEVVNLSTGYPDESLQAGALLTAATARAARRPTAWSRGPAEGIASLRAWFAAECGCGVEPADVLITPGGQAALSTAFRALASPGAAVVVESPTYIGALESARAAGLRLVPVPTDAEGIRPDLLAAALTRSGARLVYLQPLVANPTGATLARARRADVLAAVRSAGAFLIEDDYARDLVEPADAPPPLLADDDAGHVVRIRSLTKSMAPGMRIAGVVARGPAVARLRNARLVDDLFVAGVLQEAAVDVLTAPARARQLARARQALRARMAAAVSGIEQISGAELALRPCGGFVLWVRLLGRSDDDVVLAAREGGVALSPGHRWFAAEPPGSFVRVSVAAADVAQISRGIEVLHQVLT